MSSALFDTNQDGIADYEDYYGEKVCDTYVGENIIEFYCDGNDIASKTIRCGGDKLQGLYSFATDTPYCLDNGNVISEVNLAGQYAELINPDLPFDKECKLGENCRLPDSRMS